MGIAALYKQTIGQLTSAVAAGRQEAKAGVRAAAELSAGAAPARDTAHLAKAVVAPDSLKANTTLQAPRAPQGRGQGVNAAGAQRPNLRLAPDAPKADTDAKV